MTKLRDLPLFGASDQPETCRYCGTRTIFWELEPEPVSGLARQLHLCPNPDCSEIYVVEDADE